ncbi:hypothetical protein [Spiroplasma endosymbiont of Glossina fuscipes fuscipes]|uniref:hypothetical protein n=1 Tax=Spiroplasma endosymbiont of Glossina fuscipes fuscipes TaxID=2004463 RepID=UPI003C758BFF
MKLSNKIPVLISMYRVGNCLDNTVIELFHVILKTELVKNKKFKSIEEFKLEFG